MAKEGAVRKTKPVREAPGRHSTLRQRIAFFARSVMPLCNHLIQRSRYSPSPGGAERLPPALAHKAGLLVL
jgi:hypothetical protein